MTPDRRRVIRAWAIRRHIALGEAFDEAAAFVLGIQARRSLRPRPDWVRALERDHDAQWMRVFGVDDGSRWTVDEREMLQRLSTDAGEVA